MKMLLSEWFKSWLATNQLFVRASTFEARVIYVTRHLIPGFPSDLLLEELTPAMCQAYAMSKLKAGRADGLGPLSLVSVRKHVSILKQCLDDAVRLGLIRDNPARYIKLPRNMEKPERYVMLSALEAQALLYCFEDSSIFPAVVLALYYGLRRSEVLGLKWSSIDFDRGTLTVRHTVTHTSTIHAEDLTKSAAGLRTFQLLPEVADLLRPLWVPKNGLGYVLHRSDGSPLRPDSLTRTFSRTLARCGLPHMRFHDLRHSTASILFDRGWSLEDVREWLGHADIETTSNIYLHYSRSRKVLMAHDLVGLLLPKIETGQHQTSSDDDKKDPNSQ